ncbi:ABC transporter, ATP-binding protein [Mobiluncus holmesii ATCC 35242]|uniref:ABC transporter, ATP-binding protein n=2 Tax=Mobiluncus holmesii TaxID=144178 RepID=E6M3P6_9ACTO|nr:ABC transporter, ATP-binding protein [Mobiluncus holmesii ATCC 35242]
MADSDGEVGQDMWKSMTKIADGAQLRTIISWFVASAVLQGLTLSVTIWFMQSFYSGSDQTVFWLIVLTVLGLATFIVDAVAMFSSYRVSVFVVCDTMISRIAEHVLGLPLGWFNAKREAAVANATSREVNTLSHFASIVIPTLCNSFIVPLVMIIATAFISWPLALIMTAVIIPLYLIWRGMQAALTRANELENRSAQQAAGRLIEFARLQTVLRATGRSSSWDPVTIALKADSKATLDGLRIKSRPGQAFTFVVHTAFAAIVCVGVCLVNQTALTPITFLAIMAITARMLYPLTKAALIASELNNVKVALDSVTEIIDARPLPEPSTTQQKLPQGEDIEFAGVSFRYVDNCPVLNDISLVAEQGQITALVGPSGAGKSTILRLVGRFWDANSGSVKIGGADVRDIPTKDLMEMISFVFQDVYLFDMTIAENLRIAKPDASDAELESAAKRAQLDKVIEALPHGWQTNVGPAGQSLSGGERQRVAIARAFLKDAPILLLDEITSALDSENESAITKVISDLAVGRTVIVVAHRLSTIRDADKVVFLQPDDSSGAQVIQAGSVDELTAEEGPFRDFLAASNAVSSWQISSHQQQ